MDLQTFSKSSFALNSIMTLAKLPPSVGHPIARFIADQYTIRKNSSLIRCVRANQWVARGGALSPTELDEAIRKVFRHAARCYYDLYHHFHNPAALQRLSPLTPQVQALIKRSRDQRQGAMVVGAHLSNFDLVMLATAHRGLRGQGISPQQQPGGYQIQNQIRVSAGLEITPASARALQSGLQRLRTGGVVFTGVDWPIEGEKLKPLFFGRPSNLPTGHVRLALKADVPVMVITSHMSPDGKYHIDVSEPIPMIKTSDRPTTIRKNAEIILEVVADAIRQVPEQWLIFRPVWPQVLEEVP
jgi:KDO2-lipid IV(A) lauroyltransferase